MKTQQIRRRRANLVLILPLLFPAIAFSQVPQQAPPSANDDAKEEVREATGLTFSVIESYIRRGVISTDSPYGLKIRRVDGDSPAAQAGLEPGDILMRWDGKPLRSISQLRGWIEDAEPEASIAVEYSRHEKDTSLFDRHPWESRETTLVLQSATERLANEIQAAIGVRLQPLDAEEVGELAPGLRIMEVEKDSPFAGIGLEAGDVLFSWNGERVRSLEQLRDRIRADEGEIEVRFLRSERVTLEER